MITTDFKTRGDSTYAVITQADSYNNTQFSYDVGLKALDGYKQHFNQAYTELGNAVMQMAGTPKLPYTAMENWGLVIYK